MFITISVLPASVYIYSKAFSSSLLMCHSIFWFAYPPPEIPRVGPKMIRESLTVGVIQLSERSRVGIDLGSELPEGWRNFTQWIPYPKAFLYKNSGEIPTQRTSPEMNFEWNMSEIPTLREFYVSETLLIWQTIQIRLNRVKEPRPILLVYLYFIFISVFGAYFHILCE